ncbi:hypothetical protein [Microbacterium esteraromaticum]|uniref:hypothetical protein n=1 Tax=Microbacterium esteraromaticum TaxID=57043 RepID=UPI0019D38B65|nr:hypothetical protein [Microbacterium esteraromaticum]MBN7794122.1 hypothetical protein [Microbacterium esteraromaticum]
MITTPHDTGSLNRRTLLKGAAWSAPVVAMAVAVPSAAASTVPAPQVDAWAQAHMPLEAPSGTIDGTYNYYTGPRVLSYRMAYGNNGPDPIPAGATVTIDLPFAALWDVGTMQVVEDLSGVAPTFVGGTAVAYDGVNENANFNYWRWNFHLGRAIEPGESFTLTYRVSLTAATTAASDTFRVRSRATIAVGGTGAQDTNTTNNVGHSAAFTAYNSASASQDA